MKEKFNIITSTCVPLATENIDTDQIIPARFLKATSRDDFGKNLFYDQRFDAEGNPIPGFPLNDSRYSGKILVAGKNFGCGSSREHAAWAIHDYGFRVVISSFFADIHRANELNNFLLPVTVSEPFLFALLDKVTADPATEVTVDLPSQTVSCPTLNLSEKFDIDPYKKYCLINGLDDVDFLLSKIDDIKAFEKSHS